MASKIRFPRAAAASACALVAIGWIGAIAPAQAASPAARSEIAIAAETQAERICGPKRPRSRCARLGE